jgi:hypothetical protein
MSPPATYQRGSKKIDFVLVLPRLVTAVRAAGILPLNDRYLSDHRALVIDFNPLVFFGGKTLEIVAPSSRHLMSTNPKAVHEYIKFMKGFIVQHRIAEQVDELRAESIGEIEWGY